MIGLIYSLIQLYMLIILIRVVLSWMNLDPYNPIVQFLRGITDPAISALRRVLPRFFWSSGLDFTPLILIVILQLIMLFLDNLHL